MEPVQTSEETMPQVHQNTTSEEPQSTFVSMVKSQSEPAVDALAKKRSRFRRMLIFGLCIAGLAMLWMWWSSYKRRSESASASAGKGLLGMLGLNSETGGGHVAKRAATDHASAEVEDSGETATSLLDLAQRIKRSGLVLQGVSQCIWTRKQRELFGGHSSPARRVIESIYVECRTREMCPNIKGYPTWVHGDQQYPGFKSATQLRTLVNTVESKQLRHMLQGPAEPIEVNIPDERHNLKAGSSALTAEDARKMMYEMFQEMASKKAADAAAEKESNREGSGTSVSGGGMSTGAPGDGSGGSLPHTKGGAAPGSDCTESTIGNATPSSRRENVRGVSVHAPLNVPDMPGTAPFVLSLQHADFQTYQGNGPRASMENPRPTQQMMEQMIHTFDQAKQHNETRDEGEQTYSGTRFPHSADITTGEAFTDKSIPREKND